METRFNPKSSQLENNQVTVSCPLGGSHSLTLTLQLVWVVSGLVLKTKKKKRSKNQGYTTQKKTEKARETYDLRELVRELVRVYRFWRLDFAVFLVSENPKLHLTCKLCGTSIRDWIYNTHPVFHELLGGKSWRQIFSPTVLSGW